MDLAIGHSKLNARCVDRREHDFDIHPLAIFHVLYQRILASKVAVRNVSGQQRRHVFTRIMSFQIGRLPGNQRVSGTVRFVKSISRELQDHVPEFLSRFFVESIANGALNKLFVVGRNQRLFLFTDRLNAGIRGGQRNRAQTIQDPHHLFLIHHHAMGLSQNVFQYRVFVLGRLAAMFHIDVLLNHATFQRARSVECSGRNDVTEMVRLHFLQQVSNPATFQLEHTLGLAALQQGKRGFIVQRELVNIDLFATGLFDDIDGVA